MNRDIGFPAGISSVLDDVHASLGIVEETDTATHAIAKGQYVIWKGKLYTADTAIAIGTTLAASGGSKNLTYKENGGLNDLEQYPRVAVEGVDYIFNAVPANAEFVSGRYIMLAKHVLYFLWQGTAKAEFIADGNYNIITIGDATDEYTHDHNGLLIGEHRNTSEFCPCNFSTYNGVRSIKLSTISSIPAGDVIRVSGIIITGYAQ